MKKVFYLLILFILPLQSYTQAIYSITSIPYLPNPYVGANPVLVGQDDIYSPAIPIGFSFNYFGNIYDSMLISANGTISFNMFYANDHAEWSSASLVVPTNFSSFNNSNMVPFQDINPGVQYPGTNVTYETYGTAPYRRTVISFDSIPYFSCTSLLFTGQVILYETTNIIDINIDQKPTCNSWNSGSAILGLQDASATIAYCPLGRNGSFQWTASQEGWRFTPSNGGPFNPNLCKVKGKIYFDFNNNCIKDAQEYPNTNRYVYTDVGSNFAYADLNGEYTMYVDTGSYIVMHSPYNNVAITCPSTGAHIVNFSSVADSILNIDFGDSAANCMDLFSSVGVATLVYCKSNLVTVSYGNIGSQPATNISLVVTVPDSTFASNFSMPPSAQAGNVYSFQFGTIMPGQTGQITFEDSVFCSWPLIGTQMKFSSTISGAFTDCDLSNDMDTLYQTVVSSYDPNDIAVSVSHEPEAGFLELNSVGNDEWVTYKVNFQNTGTGQAYTIIVEDTIDINKLDIATASIEGASHMCALVKRASSLSLRFNDIFLPDSTSDELHSHGWVKFKIKTKPTVTIGTIIPNNVSIYFDANPPVLTNDAVLVVEFLTGINDVNNHIDIQLYPNPTADNTMIKVNANIQKGHIEVIDLQGRKVFEDSFSGSSYLLKRNGLIAGLYFIKLSDGKSKSGVQKIVFQ